MASAASRKRKERSAAAKNDQASDSIPMAQPVRSSPKGKTLYDIAAEREAALQERRAASRPRSGELNDLEPSVVTINPDGSLSGPDGEILSEGLTASIKASMKAQNGTAPPTADPPLQSPSTDEESPFAESLLYTITLCALHFTLSVLVNHQYGSSAELPWLQIAWQTLSSTPLLFFVVYLLHPRASAIWAQALFLVMSISAGFWLIKATSEYGYMAVMKKAPAVGTLWIWSAIESKVEVAILGLAVVGGFFWQGGYSIFD